MDSVDERKKEFAVKIERCRKYIDENNLDGVYLKKRCNFSWITCGGDNRIVDHSEMGWSGVLITKYHAYLITDNTEMPRIVHEELNDLPLKKIEIHWFKDELGKTIIDIANSNNIATDAGIFGLKELQSGFDRIQYQLLENEKDRFRNLGRETSKCFTKIGNQIKKGMTELDVAALISFELMKKNIQPQLILTACDNRIEDFRHPIPTFKEIDKCIMFVAVAVKWGLNLSITRFVHFGKIPDILKNKHEALLNIDARLILGTRPGKKLNELFKEHIDNFKKYGYPDEWQKLHQGGSASYRIRDVKPNIETPDSEVVKVNQAYAWNPSIAGIKSEDTILINEEDNEIISEDKNWPLVKVIVGEKEVLRPDILIK